MSVEKMPGGSTGEEGENNEGVDSEKIKELKVLLDRDLMFAVDINDIPMKRGAVLEISKAINVNGRSIEGATLLGSPIILKNRPLLVYIPKERTKIEMPPINEIKLCEDKKTYLLGIDDSWYRLKIDESHIGEQRGYRFEHEINNLQPGDEIISRSGTVRRVLKVKDDRIVTEEIGKPDKIQIFSKKRDFEEKDSMWVAEVSKVEK